MDLVPRFTHPNRQCDADYSKEFNVVGKEGFRRLDGWEKFSGRAMFARDFVFPGTLYARLLSCPYAHASIKSMDTSAAEAYPGVRKVVRYDDDFSSETSSASSFMSSQFAIDPTLMLGMVVPQKGFFEGDPIGAAVIADTDAIAQEALRLIEIEWEEYDFALECADALKDGFPVVYNPRSLTSGSDPTSNKNIGPSGVQRGPIGIIMGDVQQGFEEADHMIEFTTYKAENHARVEPVSCSFIFKEDHIDYACPGQFYPGQFAVMATGARNTYHHPVYNGGSFGHGYPLAFLMAFIGGILSQIMMGTPVKVMFDIQQSSFYTMSNDAGYDTFKVGFKDDGTITAVQEESQYNGTTYECGLTHMEENTCIPNLLCNYVGASVNRPQAFCCRSEQRIACVGLNLMTSRVADELGVDPTVIALKNDGAMGHGMDYLANLKAEQGFPARDSLKECIDVAKEAIDFDNVWHLAGEKTLPDGRKHGIGFAWDHSWTDMTFWGQVMILMKDGKAEIFGNHVDIGVNAATAYCQIAAEEIGLDFSSVYFKQNCEGHGVELAYPASASGTAVNGWAIKNAAQQLRAQILHLAINGPEQDLYPTYETPNVPAYEPYFPNKTEEELDIKGGYVFEKANPDNKFTVAEITTASGGFSSFLAPLTAWGWYSAGNWGCEAPHRERMVRQAHFVEVAVDTETGEVEVLKVINANDVGQAISPESVKGQMYGGSIMGISRGKYEASVYDPPTGVKLNANLLDYKTSTIEDCGPIETYIVETHLGYGPYGLVGVGEGCADLLPSIIGPAVQNAIGVWIDDYPITPDKVLKALGKA